MADYNTFRLILRLSVVILTISKNNDEVRNGVLAAASQLVLQPLWNVSDSLNGTNPCFVDEDVGKGMVSFTGSSDLSCRLQVTAPQGSRIQLQLPRNHSNSYGDSFLHVERLGNMEICLNKYVVIENQPEGCISTLSHQNILLVLNGEASIFVGDIPSMEIPPQCPEFSIQRLNENVSHTLNCNYVKGYSDKITCEHDLTVDYVDCRLNFQTHRNCNAILGPRDLSFQCNDFGPSQHKTKMIEYAHSLASLDLTGNRIIEISAESFLRLKTLQRLDLENNNLISLHDGSFRGLFALKILILRENKLALLPPSLFQNLRELQGLDLTSNMLSVLPSEIFRGLDNLKILLLSSNQITNLTEGLFFGLNRLNKLVLQHNMLKTLPSRLFQDLNSLEEITFYGNMLESLPDDIFKNLTNLKILKLTENKITNVNRDMFASLIALRELNVGDNMLTSLDDGLLFDGLVNLEDLRLYRNQITHFNETLFFGLNNLKIFSIEYNMLITLPNHFFKNSTEIEENVHVPNKLVNLLLSHNKLSVIPASFFKGLYNLRFLTLNSNRLTAIQTGLFQDLSALNILALSNKFTSKLPIGVFDGVPKIEYLVLHASDLTTLETDVFRGMTILKILYLSYNKFTKLNSDLFKHTGNLSFLDLSFNRLQEIPNINHLQFLKFLSLRKNNLTWISRSSFSMLTMNTDVFVSQHEICECYVPLELMPTCSAENKRSPYLTCDRLLADRALAVITWLMGINAFGGNLFVLAWRWCKKDNRTNKVNSMLLSNLAASDLLMGIYMLIIASFDMHFGEHFPMQSETWRSGVTCRIAGSLSISASEASVFFVMLISIDRFICIRFPYSDKRIGKKSAAIIATMIWLASFALGIVPSILSGINFKFYDNSHVCIGLPLALTKTYFTEETKQLTTIDANGLSLTYLKLVFNTEFTGLVNGLYFAVAVFLGLNCICYLIILGCYIEIIRAVQKSSKQVGRNRDMKEQITLTVKVTAIVATDFFCWFPIILLGILVQVRVVELPPSVYAWCVTFVLPINSAINPYLYTVSEIISNARKKRSKQSKMSKNQSCPSVSTKVHSSEVSNTSGAMGNKDNNNTSV